MAEKKYGHSGLPGCDTPLVLQFAERVFNEMPTVIRRLVERKGFISGFPGRDADRHAPGFQRFPQPHSVISSVCQKDAVIGKKALENRRLLVRARLETLCLYAISRHVEKTGLYTTAQNREGNQTVSQRFDRQGMGNASASFAGICLARQTKAYPASRSYQCSTICCTLWMQLENVAKRIRTVADHLLVVQTTHAEISLLNHLEYLHYA